ncbi:MAG TPA: type II toxin-antitoxin system RelB/DinJ family antitoxin [Gemmatimonadales bacterium]|nr:type II toxin-antitoxin system RelB/DinJ family antitoxin [Gemmatimonadales bacterium]
MAVKNAQIRVRASATLKKNAEAILERLGLTATQAITMFYQQIVLQRGIPFDVRIPNATTRRALDDVMAGRNVEHFDSVDAFADAAQGQASAHGA